MTKDVPSYGLFLRSDPAQDAKVDGPGGEMTTRFPFLSCVSCAFLRLYWSGFVTHHYSLVLIKWRWRTPVVPPAVISRSRLPR